MTDSTSYSAIDNWIDAHFDEQVGFLRDSIAIKTDTPPGDSAAHAQHTAQVLSDYGWAVESHPVPKAEVEAAGLMSITNLVIRRQYADTGPVIGLNAHGDVVPPGEGWTYPPYAGEIHDGKLYGRASAVSKSDFATFTFALRALEACGQPLQGSAELYFTYDEEFGGELGPGWLLARQIIHPDLLIAAGFSYEVVTAHNGCLQLEVTLKGTMAHAAIPDSGRDALQAAVKLLNALYALNDDYRSINSKVAGITHPYLNVGQISGGTNTNVVPGKVVLRLDRRMIPEEDPTQVEADIRAVIANTAADFVDIDVEIRRLLLARPLKPLPGNKVLVDLLKRHGEDILGVPITDTGTPLYADARLFGEAGIPAVIYGAGPRSVMESNAKRADEHIVLSDLKAATRIVARTLFDLLKA